MNSSFLGTFVNKYYKFKDFITSLMSVYEHLKNQLYQNFIEKYFIYSEDTETHTELWEEIHKENTRCFLIATSQRSFVGYPIGLQGYVVSGTDIEKIVTDPKTETEEIPFEVSPSGTVNLEFPDSTTVLYAKNVVSPKDHILTPLFGTLNRISSILLLSMYRYGVTQEMLFKFFSAVYGRTLSLEKDDLVIAVQNLYNGSYLITTTKSSYTTEYPVLVEEGDSIGLYSVLASDITVEEVIEDPVIVENVWGNEIYTNGKWGDSYEVNHNAQITYTITVPEHFEYIKYIEEVLPYWCNYKIIYTRTLDESFSTYSSNFVIFHGKYFSEEMVKPTDMQIREEYWGEDIWGDEIEEPTSHIFKDYH